MYSHVYIKVVDLHVRNVDSSWRLPYSEKEKWKFSTINGIREISKHGRWLLLLENKDLPTLQTSMSVTKTFQRFSTAHMDMSALTIKFYNAMWMYSDFCANTEVCACWKMNAWYTHTHVSVRFSSSICAVAKISFSKVSLSLKYYWETRYERNKEFWDISKKRPAISIFPDS